MSLAPFALAGVILMIGFIGDYFFKRFGIPDTLILIGLGFLLGPVLNFTSAASLAPVIPIFISLALVIILFDGGLNLKLSQVLRESSRAILLSSLGFITSIIITTLFTHYVLHWNWLVGILLGSIIGGVSSSVVLPLIGRLKTSEMAKTLLTLESVFTDSLVIIVSIAIMQLMAHGGAEKMYTGAAQGIASAFSIGIVLGLIAGLFWLKILRVIHKGIYDDVTTIAFVLFMFAIVETLGGNGAIFALIFGLVLGNGIIFSRVFRMKMRVQVDKMARKFHAQISFLIRTFFFVYIGIIFMPKSYLVIFYAGVIALFILLARIGVVNLCSIGSTALKDNRELMSIMLPRGLAAAVLSQMVVANAIPHATLISELTIMVIVLTIICSAVGTSLVIHQPEGPGTLKQ